MSMMTGILPSYVMGSWRSPVPGGPVVELRDASTGQRITSVSSTQPDRTEPAATGIDLAGALDYARTVGQASLGALSFHERALLLKQLATALTARKDELYELSACSGATRADSIADVDGGIGVLFAYSSKGRRELPNGRVVVDGPLEQLSRDGSFLGRHIFSRLPGVAVQINAFNFPVWGPLEKLAPAFLAGVPSLIKPATPTAYLSEAMVRIMQESGLLPDGSVQLVCGPVPGLLDHLGVGDLLAFTGSASTAQKLRARARPGLRFSAETDSLNASVLGLGAAPHSPEFEAYLDQLVTELTSKAGQKCTAIRRAIVPEPLVDQVVDALRARLRQVVVGDPRRLGVTMGPLVSLAQRDEVLRSVERLRDAGGAVAFDGNARSDDAGDNTDDGATNNDASSDTSAGAFLRPIVLRFDDPTTAAVHEVEAFGPVTSILSYRTTAEAVALVARGGGSLVTSIATPDPDEAAQLTLGIAAMNGRVLVLDRDDARSSTGHGSPLPHLVHGGPGRAGCGEELGGIRAVLHHMQRTAVQGSPEVLTAITGIWHPGARTNVDEVHPFRKSLSQLRLGDTLRSQAREVTLADIAHFAEFTGDTFYAHTDAAAAAANPFFPGIVAHGYLLIAFAAGLFVDPAPGPVLANYGLERLRFVTPVSPGDSIRVTLTVKQITPRASEDYGEVCWDAELTNQRGETVASYDVLTLVSK